MNGSESLINFVSDRPGQDRRYGIESNFLKNILIENIECH